MAVDYVRSVNSSQHICQHFLVVFLKWNRQAILLPNSANVCTCRFLIGLPSSPSSDSSSSTSSSSSIVRSASRSSGGGGGINEKTSPSPWVYVTVDGQHISCKLYVYSVRDASHELLDDEVTCVLCFFLLAGGKCHNVLLRWG